MYTDTQAAQLCSPFFFSQKKKVKGIEDAPQPLTTLTIPQTKQPLSSLINAGTPLHELRCLKKKKKEHYINEIATSRQMKSTNATMHIHTRTKKKSMCRKHQYWHFHALICARNRQQGSRMYTHRHRHTYTRVHTFAPAHLRAPEKNEDTPTKNGEKTRTVENTSEQEPWCAYSVYVFANWFQLHISVSS